MKPKIGVHLAFLLASFSTLCSFAIAQNAQKAVPSDVQLLQTYDARREIQLVGTVVKYETASLIPPIGAHVAIQTASGQVDVHLGTARSLQANHLDLKPGDTLRVIGEPMAIGEGTYFAARIVQKGTQAVAVRNARGFPLTGAAMLTPEQKQALRGVR